MGILARFAKYTALAMLAVLMSVEYSRATAVVSGGPPVESDIRLKRDITQVGELDSGVGLYRYRYLWKRHDLRRGHGAGSRGGNTRGSRGADGYLRVDYARLGLQLQTWDQWATR